MTVMNTSERESPLPPPLSLCPKTLINVLSLSLSLSLYKEDNRIYFSAKYLCQIRLS